MDNSKPKLLHRGCILKRMLNCGIVWGCIKVHPQLSPKEWYADSENYKIVLDLAKSINVLVLIHTGVVKNCHPLQIAPLLVCNPNQIFIMAHGRPIEETMKVLEKCSYTIVDTAFMPIDHIKLLIDK